MAFEVWDRVTGNLMGICETHEEAEVLVASFAPHQSDFLIIEVDED